MPLLSRFPRTLVIMCVYFGCPSPFLLQVSSFTSWSLFLHSNARLPAHPVTVFTDVFTENHLWFHKHSTQSMPFATSLSLILGMCCLLYLAGQLYIHVSHFLSNQPSSLTNILPKSGASLFPFEVHLLD